MTKLTNEQKREIYELYLDPTVKLKDIAATYGVNISTVSAVAIKLGASPRQTKAKYTKRASAKKCPNCNKQVKIDGAAFCPYCGADIRDAKELLVHRIRAIMPKIILLPTDTRDEMQKLLIDIQTELKKGN